MRIKVCDNDTGHGYNVVVLTQILSELRSSRHLRALARFATARMWCSISDEASVQLAPC